MTPSPHEKRLAASTFRARIIDTTTGRLLAVSNDLTSAQRTLGIFNATRPGSAALVERKRGVK